MYAPNPREALELLLEETPTALPKLQGAAGLYSLADEKGVVRYIGETGMGFHRRIHSYHCAGDDNSHKYSTVFNAGRLWQMSSVDVNPAKRAVTDAADGRIAKELRSLFARSTCVARTIELPFLTKPQRQAFESAVLALAPGENTRWNDSRLLVPYEPEGLDDFLTSLSWPSVKLEAIERQSVKWRYLDEGDRVVVRRSRSRSSSHGTRAVLRPACGPIAFWPRLAGFRTVSTNKVNTTAAIALLAQRCRCGCRNRSGIGCAGSSDTGHPNEPTPRPC